MPSSVPRTQDALLNSLRAALEPQGVHVQFGEPLELPSSYERVYVIDPADYARDRRAQFTTEHYSLQFIVEVWRPGNDLKVASDRKWELIDLADAEFGDEMDGTADDAGIEVVSNERAVYENGWLSRSVVSVPVTERF